MTALLTGLASLLVFGGVVLVHELGHFMAARHCGIHVEEFSIGFGPRLWSVQKNGTTYSLRLFPLGGYNLFSQPPEEDADPPAEESAPPRKAALFPLTVSGQQFEQATAWQRFFVTLCGALMNFLLGMAVLLVLVLSQGRLGSTTVADFGENAKSAAVLQKGDVLLQVDGKPCRTVYALSDLFDGTEKTHTMKVLRGGEVVSLPAVTVGPTLDENGRVQYATDFRVAAQPLSVHSTLVMAGELFRYYSGAILGGFWQLFTGKAAWEESLRPDRHCVGSQSGCAVRLAGCAFPDGSADDQCGHLQPAAHSRAGRLQAALSCVGGADRPSCTPARAELYQHGGHGRPAVAHDFGNDAGHYTILIRRTTMQRQLKKEVKIGNLKIGGTNPIAVQTMLNVPVKDIAGNVAQAQRVAAAGCQIVRVTVPTPADAAVVAAIKEKVDIPVVADIHFDYRAALAALDAGADKIRINPGNIGDDDRVKAVADACNAKNIPIRIGVNGGSLEKHILAKYGAPVPEAMVESAMYHVRLLQKFDFDNIVISIKSSNVPRMMAAYRLLASQTDYPLHVGVTEAGGNRMGLIKSGMGIGGLLMEGLGDTLRVSLTDEPENEVYAGYDILRAAGYAVAGPEIISCPTCGRTQYPMIEIANEVERRLRDEGFKKPLKIAIMGCVVNGPGEASDADIGIAGGKDEALLFIRGEKIRMLKGDIVGQLLEEIHKM